MKNDNGEREDKDKVCKWHGYKKPCPICNGNGEGQGAEVGE